MKDDEVVSLCKKIYITHKKAIDKIVEYGMYGSGLFCTVAEKILKGSGKYTYLWKNNTRYYFLPTSLYDILPECATEELWDCERSRVAIFCYFQVDDDTMKLSFACGPMENATLRLKLMESLKKKGFNLGQRAFNKDATYSNFLYDKIEGVDFDDENNISKTMSDLLDNNKEHFANLESVCREVFKA